MGASRPASGLHWYVSLATVLSATGGGRGVTSVPTRFRHPRGSAPGLAGGGGGRPRGGGGRRRSGPGPVPGGGRPDPTSVRAGRGWCPGRHQAAARAPADRVRTGRWRPAAAPDRASQHRVRPAPSGDRARGDPGLGVRRHRAAGTGRHPGTAPASPVRGAAAAVLASTGCASSGGPTEVAVVWSGRELDRFRRVLRGYPHAVEVISAGDDIDAFLSARHRAGNSPDVAVLPRPGLVSEYASRGWLSTLDESSAAPFPSQWSDLLRVDGRLYGAWVKA